MSEASYNNTKQHLSCIYTATVVMCGFSSVSAKMALNVRMEEKAECFLVIKGKNRTAILDRKDCKQRIGNIIILKVLQVFLFTHLTPFN